MNDPTDRDLDRRIENLPRSIGPERDLWAGIATRIAAKDVASPGRAARVSQRRWAIGAGVTASLALAAAIAMSVRTPDAPPKAPVAILPPLESPAPRGSVGESVPSPTAAKTPRSNREAHQEAVRLLLATLDQNRRDLSPAAIEKLDRSLAVLDAAIDATERALENDPDNRELGAWLLEEYQQKIDTLSAVVDLVARTS